MKGLAAGLLAAATVIGCATPPMPPTYQIGAPFDKDEASRLVHEGTNTIKGKAFIRKPEGIVTCAGQRVALVPATAYAKERVLALYGSAESGVNPRAEFTFTPDPPEYHALMRTTKCDAEGAFEFVRVGDGEFFVLTQVDWALGGSAKGSDLMQRVLVRDGQSLSVIMSP